MKKILIMKNGTVNEVTGENDRYYLCGDVQFRKSNPMIDHLEAVKEPKVEEVEESEEEEKPKKKPKKKVAED